MVQPADESDDDSSNPNDKKAYYEVWPWRQIVTNDLPSPEFSLRESSPHPFLEVKKILMVAVPVLAFISPYFISEVSHQFKFILVLIRLMRMRNGIKTL